MPIGASKVGALGGLVPGGTETFNAPGTFSIPPGVKKVSVTGVGGTGNPGNSGTAGNPGNPGGGAGGGGGGGGSSPCPFVPITSGGSGGASPGGGNGGAGGNQNPPSFFANAGSPGNAGNNGTAGSAGSTGNPGNAGGTSSALGQNFAGGPGGNAGAAGNAGNQGNGGTAGNGGAEMNRSPSFPNTGVAVGNGGNGGGAGVAANLKGTNAPYTCARNGETLPGQRTRFYNNSNPGLYMQFCYLSPIGGSSHGGGGGAGDVNSGTNFNIPGQKAGNRFVTATSIENPTPPSIIPAPIAPGPYNHPGQPVCIINASLAPLNSPPTARNSVAFFTRAVPLRGAGGNPGGGAGGYGGVFGYRGWTSPPVMPMTASANYTSQNIGLTNSGFSATNARAGGGGGGGGLALDNPCIPNGGGGGGGGGRGNAGNAGGAGGSGGSGVAATPSTVNCVPVTPGGTAPITVASPGGQIVISWNPQ